MSVVYAKLGTYYNIPFNFAERNVLRCVLAPRSGDTYSKSVI